MHMTEMFTTQYPGLHNSVLLVYLFLFTVFVFLLPSHFRKLSLSNVPVNIIFDHCQLWPSVFVIGFDISSPWPLALGPKSLAFALALGPKSLSLALALIPQCLGLGLDLVTCVLGLGLALGPKSLLTSLIKIQNNLRYQ